MKDPLKEKRQWWDEVMKENDEEGLFSIFLDLESWILFMLVDLFIHFLG